MAAVSVRLPGDEGRRPDRVDERRAEGKIHDMCGVSPTMDRRSFLRTLAAGGTLVSTGCVGSTSVRDETSGSLALSDPPDVSGVFAGHRFDGTDLVVQFRDGVDVRRAVLGNRATGAVYETIERPTDTLRFPVVFPDRLETHVSGSLTVRAETEAGWAREWIPGTVHGAVRNVTVLPDGRARLEIQNQGNAPLLVRFVGIYGDVPNPTIDPHGDAFDRSSFDRGPGVVGVDQNRPLSSSRTDLVVHPGETAPFETTYPPFAFPDGADPHDCESNERTASIAVVNASSGRSTETVTVRLGGTPAAVDGRTSNSDGRPTADVCTDVTVEG